MSRKLLDENTLRAALAQLGHRASARGILVELRLVGGAAMALAFGARASTRDVDSVASSPSLVALQPLLDEVASTLGLPSDWLNDHAARFVVRASEAVEVLRVPGLIVTRPATE